MTMNEDDETEKLLDPAAERLRRRMVRLLAVSTGIMVIGLMTVVGAIVYKVSEPSSEGAGAGRATPSGTMAIELPAGSQPRDMALDGNRALIRVEHEGGEGLILVDLTTGGVLARYDFQQTR
ncbi:hypothetical protein [Consotaella aegiceratis]|uniref:hypothetical protein n=1 Tax=Consotaella aegiceratis TaxID=3097961 RepID=UPI002F411968